MNSHAPHCLPLAKIMPLSPTHTENVISLQKLGPLPRKHPKNKCPRCITGGEIDRGGFSLLTKASDRAAG